MGRVTHYDTVQMMAYLLSQRENVAKYWVTVTAGQTHTISSLGVSAATIVDWGDGLSNEYTGTATRTHVYASAGTYEVKIYTPQNVITFYLSDAKVSVLNSSYLKGMVNVSTFLLFNLTSATIALNSADMVDWRPGNFTLYNLPNATITIAPSTIKNWSGVTVLVLRTRNLTQQQADLVLWECYQIARTVAYGTINLDGAGNAAPSGTFQPCQSPPVSASTPGKEIAYELLNDSLGVGFNKWATVNTN